MITIEEYKQYHDDDEFDYSEPINRSRYEVIYEVDYEDREGRIRVPYGEGAYCDIAWVYAEDYLEAEAIAEELREQGYGEIEIRRRG